MKIVIEIEIGIFRPLFVVGLTHLKKAPPRPGQLVQFLFNQNSSRAKNDRRSSRSLSYFACKTTLASIISQPHDQPASCPIAGGCVVEGSGKNSGAVKSSPIFGVPLAQQPAVQLIDPAARAHSPCHPAH